MHSISSPIGQEATEGKYALHIRLGRWSCHHVLAGQLTDFVVVRRLLSPKIQCIINLLFHYVRYVVVELSVNDISFANIVVDTS